MNPTFTGDSSGYSVRDKDVVSSMIGSLTCESDLVMYGYVLIQYTWLYLYVARVSYAIKFLYVLVRVYHTLFQLHSVLTFTGENERRGCTE